MEQFTGIQTIIFDFGGVIINLDLNQCIRNFKQLGLENFEENLSLFGQKGFFLQYEKGEIDTDQFRAGIRSLTSNPLSNQEIDNAWCSFLCDIPEKRLLLLNELRKRFRVVMLSNTNPLHIEVSAEREFRKIGKTLNDFFDYAYLSYKMKLAKPYPEIFRKVLETEQVEAHQCLFLDDGVKNIEQAQEMGFRTYLVQPGEDLDFLLNPEILN